MSLLQFYWYENLQEVFCHTADMIIGIYPFSSDVESTLRELGKCQFSRHVD